MYFGVELARQLVAEQFPSLARLPVSEAARGWDNVMFRLGDDLAIRLPHRDIAAGLVESESIALGFLGPRLASVTPELCLPTPVFDGQPCQTLGYPYRWSIVRWVRGEVAISQPVSQRNLWASTLAEALVAIQVPDDASRAPANPYRGVPLEQRLEITGHERLRERLDRVAPEHRGALERKMRKALDAPKYDGPPVWLHGDPHPGNLIVNPAVPGRLAGIIDFGDSTAGDPASDLGALWLTFDETGRNVVRDAMRGHVDDDTWTRAAGWALQFASAILDHPEHPDLLPDARRALTELAS